MLTKEITPRLEKLRAEESQYVKFSANTTECERLSRFVIASEFATAFALLGAGAAEGMEAEMERVIVRAAPGSGRARARDGALARRS